MPKLSERLSLAEKQAWMRARNTRIPLEPKLKYADSTPKPKIPARCWDFTPVFAEPASIASTLRGYRIAITLPGTIRIPEP